MYIDIRHNHLTFHGKHDSHSQTTEHFCIFFVVLYISILIYSCSKCFNYINFPYLTGVESPSVVDTILKFSKSQNFTVLQKSKVIWLLKLVAVKIKPNPKQLITIQVTTFLFLSFNNPFNSFGTRQN